MIRSRLERRILVNYRIDPDALASLLPAPFRPAIVGGYAVAGICLIRLGRLRPVGLPARLGITTENAAHRIAVEWDTAGGPVAGVFVPRRDTSSRLTAALGGRAHHPARFHVEEDDGAYRIEMASLDGEVEIRLAAHGAGTVMAGSVFDTVEAASDFFRCAPVGLTPSPRVGVFDRVALTVDRWAIEPLELDEVRSSVFDALPATPDSAFLMHGVDATWRARPTLLEAAR
ncbi:MAG: DUF2071 domain-containing protein [Acidimicrobiales bacterium]